MSFKDVIKDFTQSEVVLNAEAIRRQAWGFLLGGIGLMLIFITYALVVYFSDDPTIALQVIAHSKEIAETTLITPDGTFNNGQSGILQYHPKSFIDILIFNSIGLFNIVDFAFALYIGILMLTNSFNISDFTIEVQKYI
jgi:hypothetical protein